MAREDYFKTDPPTLNEALDAVANLVRQFAYHTEFYGKPAYMDGGLSALENAFDILQRAGCRMNSNGTIQESNLDKFMERMEDETS